MNEVVCEPVLPTAEAQRSSYLDVLRGLAMLGILPVNVMYFALSTDHGSQLYLGSNAGIGEWLAMLFVKGLCEYKFITTFSLLFGVGLGLLWTRRPPGVRGWVLVRRLGFLWVVGVLHAVFLWFGDILAFYAVVGVCMLVPLALGLSSRTLIILGVVLIALPALLVLGVAVVLAVWPFPVDTPPDELPPVDGSWQDFWVGMTRHFEHGYPDRVFQEGSFARITALRAYLWVVISLFMGVYLGPRTLGLMLLGIAWLQQGWFLDPARNRGHFRKLLVWGLVLGAPLTVLSCIPFPPPGEHERAMPVLSELAAYLGSLGLAAALWGGVGLLVAGGRAGAALGPLAAVGRTAFSNYILQSVIMCLLFYPQGLGLHGQLDRVQLLGVVAVVWGAELLVSVLWLRAFRFGPLEWVWRCVTYLRMAPLLRARGAANP